MTAVTLKRPWLEFDLGGDMQVLSWAINRPGFVTARRIFWREVRNADLSEDFDVARWLSEELEDRQAADAVTLLTSRDIGRYKQATASVGGTTAHCVATVGLTNAERVGFRTVRAHPGRGTINIAIRLTAGLSQTGLLETLSIATQARTAAIIEVGLPLRDGPATGTGTDCIAVAAPIGTCTYAGLHTDIGEAVGRAVYRATLAGARDWMDEFASARSEWVTNAQDQRSLQNPLHRPLPGRTGCNDC
ncbi:adenosylcobinamide amidohydrolase [Sedimentitalea sp. JM2-8]|uniref:Adenosylcobinamide amidohydrolase n=1 Tax=Sedimentitalea xiamensis TaxID=3050037 RepID=A0ABT7FHT5_9RHOB|nr:adenosylcobinamide amidohydrolase [Sedimentitalea xiamensis]MDK3074701.1 adenosylcobinamide amidohydrolase [Sedimentitalea xiamensis]